MVVFKLIKKLSEIYCLQKQAVKTNLGACGDYKLSINWQLSIFDTSFQILVHQFQNNLEGAWTFF